MIGNTNALLNANLSINGNYVAPVGSNAVDILFPQVVGSSLIFGNNISSATIGSINSVNPGDGNIILTTDDGESSAIALTIGNNNQNSNISGIISDTSQSITNYGGSITKIGTGTLTLGGANTYSGGTTISSGTFVAANTSGSATGSADVNLNGGISPAGRRARSPVIFWSAAVPTPSPPAESEPSAASPSVDCPPPIHHTGLRSRHRHRYDHQRRPSHAGLGNHQHANGTLLNFAGTYSRRRPMITALSVDQSARIYVGN